LTFQPGIRARVVLVVFRSEFWRGERPEAIVRFGEANWVDRPDLPNLIPIDRRCLTE
jgi:hypothetical protein